MILPHQMQLIFYLNASFVYRVVFGVDTMICYNLVQTVEDDTDTFVALKGALL